MICSYCGNNRGHENRDHIVPKYLRLRFPQFNDEEWLVDSCHRCNAIKYTFRWVPESHEDKIPFLKEVTSYTFKVYRGERLSEMFP